MFTSNCHVNLEFIVRDKFFRSMKYTVVIIKYVIDTNCTSILKKLLIISERSPADYDGMFIKENSKFE